MGITRPGQHPLWIRFAVALGCLLMTAMAGYGQTCLHGADESQGERARREAAMRFVRQVNDAEASLPIGPERFRPLGSLTGLGSPPVGFVPRMTVDDWGYVIVVKDLLDPCGFGLFSAEDAVIYEARPVAANRPVSAPKVARARIRLRK